MAWRNTCAVEFRSLVERDQLEPGTRLPWDDPDFSARMLREHLAEWHDLASRRPATIDAEVSALRTLVAGEPARVLDLGCGPGLHLERFERAGWSCVGLDVSPAAIAYAGEHAGASSHFVLGDVRSAQIDGSFDLVLMLFGELSTFDPTDVTLVVQRIGSWLAPEGRAVIEVSTSVGVDRKAARGARWYSAQGGLFADGPHLVLQESQLIDDASVERWWVLDPSADAARSYESTTWKLTSVLDPALADADLAVVARLGSIDGSPPTDDDDFTTLVLARR